MAKTASRGTKTPVTLLAGEVSGVEQLELMLERGARRDESSTPEAHGLMTRRRAEELRRSHGLSREEKINRANPPIQYLNKKQRRLD